MGNGGGHAEVAVDGSVLEEFHGVAPDVGDEVFHGVVGAGHGPDDGVHLIEQLVSRVGDLFYFGQGLVLHFALYYLAHQADGCHAGAELVVHVGGDPIAFVLFGGEDGHLLLQLLSFRLQLQLFFFLDALDYLHLILVRKGEEEEEQLDGDAYFVMKKGEVQHGDAFDDMKIGGDDDL